MSNDVDLVAIVASGGVPVIFFGGSGVTATCCTINNLSIMRPTKSSPCAVDIVFTDLEKYAKENVVSVVETLNQLFGWNARFLFIKEYKGAYMYRILVGPISH